MNSIHIPAVSNKDEENSIRVSVAHYKSNKTLMLTCLPSYLHPGGNQTTERPFSFEYLRLGLMPMPRYNAKKEAAYRAEIESQIKAKTGEYYQKIKEYAEKLGFTLI